MRQETKNWEQNYCYKKREDSTETDGLRDIPLNPISILPTTKCLTALIRWNKQSHNFTKKYFHNLTPKQKELGTWMFIPVMCHVSCVQCNVLVVRCRMSPKLCHSLIQVFFNLCELDEKVSFSAVFSLYKGSVGKLMSNFI